MGETRELRVDLTDELGHSGGSFIIRVLARGRMDPASPPLLDLRDGDRANSGLEPLQLLEGEEYGYELHLAPNSAADLHLEPQEMFYPDADTKRRGRLRTGLYTGTLAISAWSDGRHLGQAQFEVRSRKLDYVSQYRWMLRDVADGLADLVMERFAPTEQRFARDDLHDAATLYQRFAFLKNLMSGEAFETAMHLILARPHRAWVVEEELRRPGQSLSAGSGVARQVGGPGPRIPWPQGGNPSCLASLPAMLQAQRTEETVDTAENRFIKFILTYWQGFVTDVRRALAAEPLSAPVRRGLQEVESVADRLDELLSAERFREVGRLVQFPVGSQVLQKRAGYRDLYRAYVQFEAAAMLAWDGAADVYGAGQRDVATLYEYWVYLKLVEIVGQLCHRDFDRTALFELRPDGLGVALKRGRRTGLSGSLTRLGRRLKLDLWFNQTFSARQGESGSWSRSMRPDCSLRIRAETPGGYQSDEVWVHFDAKYRVENLAALFGMRPASDDEEAQVLNEEQTGDGKLTSKRSDLLKMHAYRDAIRKTAGAYVIYPGTEPDDCRMYHEILPGLGAFALRPTDGGGAEGANVLRDFIDNVLTHVASQVTQDERTRYWVREANRPENQVHTAYPASPFLSRPPADTLVLLGFVRNERHLQWIQEHKRYNLRADDRNGSVGIGARELAVELVLLYGPSMVPPELWRVDGPPELLGRERMLRAGYAEPGEAYFCLPIAWVEEQASLARLTLERLMWTRSEEKPDAPFGAPVVVTWLDLVR